MGRRLPVRRNGGELSFELPRAQGSFRGRFEGGVIRGHWVRPATSVNITEYASPLTLRRQKHRQWSGIVDPAEDSYTFYLLVQSRPDGSLSAVLRNPEFDYGTQQRVERIVPDGNHVRLVGKRGPNDRDVGSGTYDAETGALTLTLARGGIYEFARENPVGSDFLPRANARYAYRPPLALDDGWPVGTLEAAAISSVALERLVQAIIDAPMEPADAQQIHGIVIARNGKLVLEEYFHGEHRDKLHSTRSAGKSLTAIIVGAAMKSGAPLSLTSPVYSVMNGGAFPSDLEPAKRLMTLEHLLTMSSGYDCDDTNEDAPGNEDVMLNQSEEPDFYRYTLRVPLATTPGSKAVYCSADANLALGMVGRATGQNPLYSFDRLVAEPLKIRNYSWPLDPARNPYGGGSVALKLRDFLKLGQLMLNGGTWNGRLILDSSFTKAATTPSYRLRNITYGFLWWQQELPYKDRAVRAYSALGAGGQSVTVVPDLNLVVATFAGNYFSAKGSIATSMNLLPRHILPAVREKGDDRGAPIRLREYSTPYGASKDGSRVTRGD
jgi:CubicO group peptidase (beta-lactamase class C family)